MSKEKQMLLFEQKGKKFSEGKTKWHLLPMSTVEKAVRAMMYGEKKYGRDDWKYLKNWRDEFYSAAIRHLVEWKYFNKKIDEESKLETLAHALTNIIYLLYLDEENKNE